MSMNHTSCPMIAHIFNLNGLYIVTNTVDTVSHYWNYLYTLELIR